MYNWCLQVFILSKNKQRLEQVTWQHHQHYITGHLQNPDSKLCSSNYNDQLTSPWLPDLLPWLYMDYHLSPCSRPATYDVICMMWNVLGKVTTFWIILQWYENYEYLEMSKDPLIPLDVLLESWVAVVDVDSIQVVGHMLREPHSTRQHLRLFREFYLNTLWSIISQLETKLTMNVQILKVNR